jgi:nitroimidazol reductase NimA-like FMN-containing flavoprotein (pyridoxamine 5'-phosphate oxidase superfamily)
MKPRELSDEECLGLLEKVRYGRLGLSLNGLPYVIPMSYVFFDGKIFLHSRGRGKKVEYVSQNPQVCFQIDLLDKNRWTSVIALGRACLSEDLESKKKMFDAFTAKGLGGHGGKQFQREELEKMQMTIWEIEVEELSGREGMW